MREDLKAAGTTTGASHRLRAALVIAEIALAVVLLVGAGLFIRSFVTLTRVDIGFDYHNVLALSVRYPLPMGHPEEIAEIRTSNRGNIPLLQMLDAIARVPGVEAVGSVNGGLPLTGSWSRTKITLPGRGEQNGDGDDIDWRPRD